MKSISIQECQSLLEAKSAQLLDVREPWETEICCKEGIKIPMDDVLKSIHQLDFKKKIIVLCKTGKRAEAVANLLITEFPELDVCFLEGGITKWLITENPNFEIY